MEELRKKLYMAALAGTATDTSNYLTIRALEDNVSISLSKNVDYNANGAGWETLTAGQTVTVDAGEYVCFKKEMKPGTWESVGGFFVSGSFGLEGNCMSMVFGDNAKDAYDLKGYPSVFGFMFVGCTGLKTISNNFLPATELDESVYYNMFSSCTGLVNAPELPATTLTEHCYYGMFAGCESLATAPELPATSLAGNCYCGMFEGCPSLTTAPELPATTLAESCYYRMFYGCRKIEYIKMLATNIQASDCLHNWVKNISTTGTFVKSSNATWNVTGDSGVPTGWTVQYE